MDKLDILLDEIRINRKEMAKVKAEMAKLKKVLDQEKKEFANYCQLAGIKKFKNLPQLLFNL